ncbi:MAG: carboxyl transferase domain-containing protein [Gammaproteobacteria bacterium]|nr:carboxyl transferase domain-containing protein [Gammaproteobacteria bacterium]
MMISKLLIANRGEIAIRIMRSAANLDIRTVAINSKDDGDSLHVFRADEAVLLPGEGVAAYLDAKQIIELARENDCDAIHPGYGFLSENADFALACNNAGLRFVGPSPETLALFGDKAKARRFAASHDIPVLSGTLEPTSLEQAGKFLKDLDGGTMILKAVAGGGGRGVRIVEDTKQLASAFAQSSREANAAFANDDLYVEEFLSNARHIEVQVLGDEHGKLIHLGERDCSLQRRHQKVIEIAPAPDLDSDLREKIIAAAVKLAAAADYSSAGTIEFLVDTSANRFVFIEANARLQVEHTISEEIYEVDLVEAQLRIADGESIAELGLDQLTAKGFAIQLRINMETMQADGTTRPSGGMISAFNPPSGPGIRLDTYAYSSYSTNPRFDSLLAKLIVVNKKHDFRSALAIAYRSLCEFQIEGVASNLSFLQAILTHEEVKQVNFYTRFIDDNVAMLVEQNVHQQHYMAASLGQVTRNKVTVKQAGATVESDDPLAILAFGQQQTKLVDAEKETLDESWMLSPMQGTIVDVLVSVGDEVMEGATLAIMDSMKMEHEIKAGYSGVIDEVSVRTGDTLYEQQPIMSLIEKEIEVVTDHAKDDFDLDYIRSDLLEVATRRTTTLDERRPTAVARRRKTGQRTARENIADLVDDGTMVEYGQLVLAAQRRRRTRAELIEKSPADGMVTAVASINGQLFPDPVNRCVVLSYDYTVFAGTQGAHNHRKTDRMISLAKEGRMPMVIFAEGGGGRPGDTEGGGETGTFCNFPQLSGLVPMVGITSGRCFAGNASLLGCCDVIIATENSNIGMGGPAMVEGGGLGNFAPEDIGPMSVQVPNGTVDILVEDEQAAVEVAQQYLSYFQGAVKNWQAPDQRIMRRIVPENRLRVYDIRSVIDTIADEGSVLELRRGFGVGSITSLIRIEGRPLGVFANNPAHLGGAIDSDAADKASRFLQLCDAFDLPILYLCDTPGMMVGPEVEKTALVRHSSRLFLTATNLSVPTFTIVIRKAYGLGAIAMAGGSFKNPLFTISWPTGEYGGMGLEGSVKLGYRAELAAIEDPQERKRVYEEKVAQAYEKGKALNSASLFGIDDTIDPADSRFWVSNLLKSVRRDTRGSGKKIAFIDAW